MNNITRPEGQPRHIVDSDAAKVLGRYSGGNHKKFSEFQVIHVPSEFIPNPLNCGASGSLLTGTLSETEDKHIVPISVSRYEIVLSNDLTEVTR